jgi:hypothetical protein
MHEVRDGALAPTAAWEATRERLVARIGEIIAAIRRGEFPVFNDNPQCTSFCDLRTICRIAQVRSLEKQWPVTQDHSASGSHAKAQRREGQE